MKYGILSAAIAAIAIIGADAAVPGDLRIYIDPGHGSWTPDDRPCTLIDHPTYSTTKTDTLSFYESNTNLRKAFGVLEKMKEYGFSYDATANSDGQRWEIGAARDLTNNIVMGHVKCGPYLENNSTLSQQGAAAPAELAYYNRNLIEVAQEVDINNFDIFVCIHSNANVDGDAINFPTMLYRGRDAANMSAETGMTAYLQKEGRNISEACWKYAIENPHMGWTHYTNGTMSLRGDRDFYVNSLTACRSDVKGYLGALKHSTPGVLIEGYFHTYQPARHRAMNFDVDYMEGTAYAHGIADYLGLTKEATGDIYGIVRDAKENFSHANYKPNQATLDIFKPLNGTKVILKKDGQPVAEYTTDNYYNGAFVFRGVTAGDYTLAFEAEGYLQPDQEVAVKVTPAQISYPIVSLVSETWIDPSKEYVDFPDKFISTSICPSDEYKFKTSFVDKIFTGIDNVIKAVNADDRIYILSTDANGSTTINVIDGTFGTVSTSIPAQDVLDIAAGADGMLYALGADGVCYWSIGNTGLPTGEATTVVPAITGAKAIAVSGTLKSGDIYILTEAGVESIHIAAEHTPEIKTVGIANLTGIRSISLSPFAPKSILLTKNDGSAIYSYDLGNGNTATLSDTIEMPGYDLNGASFFKFGGRIFASVPKLDGENVVAAEILDFTRSKTKPKIVTCQGTAVGPKNSAAFTGVFPIMISDADGNVTRADIDLYIVNENATSAFTTRSVAQASYTNGYAHSLEATADGDIYTLSFQTTKDIPAAKIVLTPVAKDNDNEEIIIDLGPVKAAQTISHQIDSKTLEGKYTWRIEAHNHPVTQASKILTIARGTTNGANPRGGVVPITDPHSPAYGYTLVSYGYASGIDYIGRDGKVIGRYHANAPFDKSDISSPIRGAELDGKAVFADWSKASAGYWVVDPTDADADPVNMMAGEHDANGIYTYGGTVIGGRASTVAFYGEGIDKKMYTFRADAAGNHSLAAYNIGNERTIKSAPDNTFNNKVTNASLMLNTNVEIAPTSHGLFVSQQRAVGNNVKSVPVFIFIDDKGNQLLNSADVVGLTSGSTGIAVNKEETILAVGTYSAINIYSIEWDKDTPKLTYQYEFNYGYCDWTQLKFDHAGYLHAYLRNAGYSRYALMDPEPVITTPAHPQYVLIGRTTGVSELSPETETDGPEEYYDLRGIRMSSDNLAPGLYIRRQGTRTSKVVVR